MEVTRGSVGQSLGIGSPAFVNFGNDFIEIGIEILHFADVIDSWQEGIGEHACGLIHKVAIVMSGGAAPTALAHSAETGMDVRFATGLLETWPSTSLRNHVSHVLLERAPMIRHLTLRSHFGAGKTSIGIAHDAKNKVLFPPSLQIFNRHSRVLENGVTAESEIRRVRYFPMIVTEPSEWRSHRRTTYLIRHISHSFSIECEMHGLTLCPLIQMNL